MSRSSRNDSSITPTQSMEHRLTMYSMMGVAAGVGLLALAQPAEAELVITKKTIPIPVSQLNGTPHPVLIDMNGDGVNDLSFYLYSFAYHAVQQDLTVTPLQGGAVVASPGQNGQPYVSALMRGAKIGPSAHFSSKNFEKIEGEFVVGTTSNFSTRLYGKWGGNPKNRYVGVRFLVDGQTHYGWVRLTVTSSHGITATITAYAYETIPNKKILAGIDSNAVANEGGQKLESPAGPSLGMLALGADGLALWKRDEFVPSHMAK